MFESISLPLIITVWAGFDSAVGVTKMKNVGSLNAYMCDVKG
jgi:hypothetical protein